MLNFSEYQDRRLKDLLLQARLAVDSFLAGVNKSRLSGTGLSFNGYRPYLPGDDLRTLDWKLYARSDRYHVKEAEFDTSVHLRFLVDQSPSMAHQISGPSKMETAKLLTACLAYLGHMNGDSSQLAFFGQEHEYAVEKQAHFFARLSEVTPTTSPLPGVMRLGRSPVKELVICVTDLYEKQNEIRSLLASSNPNQELIVFHLVTQEELDFSFEESTLEDLETGKKVYTGGAKKAYLSNLTEYLAGWKSFMVQHKIDYQLYNTSEPIFAMLKYFLSHRNQMQVGRKR